MTAELSFTVIRHNAAKKAWETRRKLNPDKWSKVKDNSNLKKKKKSKKSKSTIHQEMQKQSGEPTI